MSQPQSSLEHRSVPPNLAPSSLCLKDGGKDLQTQKGSSNTDKF